MSGWRQPFLAPRLAALALAAAYLWTLRYFLVDDSFIPLRYLTLWHEGHGLVWNPGERVEGYSSPLMVWLLMPFAGLGDGVLLVARAIGLLSLAALVAMFRLGSARCNDRGLPAATATVLLLTSVPLLYWAQSGLETVLFAALLTCAWLSTLIALDEKMTHPLVLATAYALATWARPEGALFALIAFAFLARRHRRDAAIAAGAYGAAVALHLLWRYHYYGDWLPNTFYAKLGAAATAEQWSAGLRYLLPLFLRPPFLGVAACLGLALAWRRLPRDGNAFLAVSALAYTAYLVHSGGDWMPEQRFLVPLIPLCLLMLVRGLHAAYEERPNWRGWPSVPWAALLLSLFAWPHAPFGAFPKFPIYLQAEADYIRQHWPPDSLIAINTAGIVPAMTPAMRYVDMLGINDRTIARTPPSGKIPFQPGHFRGNGAYVLSRKPDYIIFGDGVGAGNNADHPRYISEVELAASPAFRRDYELRRVTLPVDTPHVPTQSITFEFYARRNAR